MLVSAPGAETTARLFARIGNYFSVHAAEEGECGFPQPGLGGNSPILVYPPPPQGLEGTGGGE
jgi:hypothetical protein